MVVQHTAWRLDNGDLKAERHLKCQVLLGESTRESRWIAFVERMDQRGGCCAWSRELRSNGTKAPLSGHTTTGLQNHCLAPYLLLLKASSQLSLVLMVGRLRDDGKHQKLPAFLCDSLGPFRIGPAQAAAASSARTVPCSESVQ